MSSTSDFREEKAALDAVFASGIFQRAPNMARLLSYVCAKYFEGQQDQLKEYNIAVEAFGRSPDFDQERDSIVRVEAHRLRKRLIEFYEREGVTHKVRIVMPVGHYVPQFVRRLPEEKAEARPMNSPGESVRERGASTPPVPASAVKDVIETPKRPAWLWRTLAGAAALLVCGIVVFLVVWSRPASLPVAATAAIAPQNTQSEDIRILAGWVKEPYTDPFGHLWQADRYVTGGYVTNYAGHIVDGARDAKLFETAREGDFQYDIPLAPGVYELRLYFAEMLFGKQNVGGGGEGSRIFNVEANGKRLLSRFDVISDAAGANLADERVFKDISPDADGFLHLRFTHLIRDALLNAIEIKPGLPGRLRPIRILTSEHAYVDRAGALWEADRYYRGGQLIHRPHPVSGASDPAFYRSQRCGHLTYVIPAAPGGTYSMTLRFAEGWHGTGNPVAGGVGSRQFNIFCNSQTLARNFDIYKEAGGAERAVERTFHGLRPSPQGKLVLYLQPVESYACINAIEVLDEGK